MIESLMRRNVLNNHRRRSIRKITPPDSMMPEFSDESIQRVPAILILLCILASLFYLRMIPAIHDDVEFVLDSAFHYRMTDILVRTGALPSTDTLSTYPHGKDVRSLLPSGIYHACTAFHGAVNLFTAVPLKTAILLFCSLCGSLIAIPVYLISLELYHSRLIGLGSAALAGLAPAYLNRTLCYWYRYEILAVPILFLSFLFFLRTFKPSDDKRTILNASMTSVLLVAALYIWRLSVLFVIAYAGCLLYLSLRSARNVRKVVMAGCFLLCLYAVLLLFVPGFGMRNPGFNYGSFPRAVLEINLNRMGARAPFSDFTRLVFDNQELQGVGVLEMFKWEMLSLSAGFIGMFLLFYLSSGERSAQRDILFASLLIFSALALLVSRNVVMLAPFAGIIAGDGIRFVRERKRGKGIRYGMLAVILIISSKTAWDGYRMASIRHVDARVGASLSQALIRIGTLTPPAAAVSCYWADGYMVQTYCNRPTLTDGLFESREIVGRILEESKAYYSQNEDDLWNYCTRYGARYLLVPARRTLSYADQAGVPYGRYFSTQGPTRLGSLTVLYRLLYEPGSIKRFREIFRNREYALFEIIGSTSQSQPAAP